MFLDAFSVLYEQLAPVFFWVPTKFGLIRSCTGRGVGFCSIGMDGLTSKTEKILFTAMSKFRHFLLLESTIGITDRADEFQEQSP